MKNSISKEDREEILENLVSLSEKGDVTKENLASRLKKDQYELDSLLSILEGEGNLKIEKSNVKPTTKGTRFGRRMVRKHRLLERFLHDVLGLKKETVHDEACKLEHALSDDAEDALCRFLEHPQQCPDQSPIPECKHRKRDCKKCGTVGTGDLLPLDQVETGTDVTIKFIQGGKKAVQRLRDMGLVPDVCITVKKKTPMGGPIELEVCGTTLALGRGITSKIFVEV